MNWTVVVPAMLHLLVQAPQLAGDVRDLWQRISTEFQPPAVHAAAVNAALEAVSQG